MKITDRIIHTSANEFLSMQVDVEALNHQIHENILSRNKKAENEKYLGKIFLINLNAKLVN